MSISSLHIDPNEIVGILLDGFQTVWQSLFQPLINALLELAMNSPMDEISLIVAVVSVAGLAIRRWKRNLFQ